MLPTNVLASGDHLRQAAIRCAWAEWAAVGASTSRRPKAGDEIVDIEALILGSIALQPHDDRLGTIAADWTIENSELVSIARLRAAYDGHFAETLAGLEALADSVAVEAGDHRWLSLLPHRRLLRERARSEYSTRKAAPVRWIGAHTFLLHLRRAFGAGVKSDLLAVLAGRPETWTDAASLADLSGYTVAAVRRAADELADATLVHRSAGTRRTYRIGNVDFWAAFVGDARPVWRRRLHGFAFVHSWSKYLESPAAARATEVTTAAMAFATRQTQYTDLFLEAGCQQQPINPVEPWDQARMAVDALIAWFGMFDS